MPDPRPAGFWWAKLFIFWSFHYSFFKFLVKRMMFIHSLSGLWNAGQGKPNPVRWTERQTPIATAPCLPYNPNDKCVVAAIATLSLPSVCDAYHICERLNTLQPVSMAQKARTAHGFVHKYTCQRVCLPLASGVGV